MNRFTFPLLLALLVYLHSLSGGGTECRPSECDCRNREDGRQGDRR